MKRITKEQRERRIMEIRDMYKNTTFTAQEIANIYKVSKALVRTYTAIEPIINRKRVSVKRSKLRKKLLIAIYRDKREIDPIEMGKELGCTASAISKLLTNILGIKKKSPFTPVEIKNKIIEMTLAGHEHAEILDACRDKGITKVMVSQFMRVAKYVSGEITEYYDEVVEKFKQDPNVDQIRKDLNISKYKAYTIIFAYQYKTGGLYEKVLCPSTKNKMLHKDKKKAYIILYDVNGQLLDMYGREYKPFHKHTVATKNRELSMTCYMDKPIDSEAIDSMSKLFECRIDNDINEPENKLSPFDVYDIELLGEVKHNKNVVINEVNGKVRITTITDTEVTTRDYIDNREVYAVNIMTKDGKRTIKYDKHVKYVDGLLSEYTNNGITTLIKYTKIPNKKTDPNIINVYKRDLFDVYGKSMMDIVFETKVGFQSSAYYAECDTPITIGGKIYE